MSHHSHQPGDKRNETSGKILAGTYHKAQEQMWDGYQILDHLIAQYGKISLRNVEATSHVLNLILRGEFAAWNVAARLIGEFNDLEPKLAATAQAHDESRHFYVIQEYMLRAGCETVQLPHSAAKMINNVLSTTNLTKKVLGMHLMVEPIALTLFREIRHAEVEPVLCGLMRYMEKDEARHIAIGVHHLPTLVEDLSFPRLVDLAGWQLKMLMLEVDSMREMLPYFQALGIDVEKLYAAAEQRQLEALQTLSASLGWSPKIWEPLRKIIHARKTWVFRK